MFKCEEELILWLEKKADSMNTPDDYLEVSQILLDVIIENYEKAVFYNSDDRSIEEYLDYLDNEDDLESLKNICSDPLYFQEYRLFTISIDHLSVYLQKYTTLKGLNLWDYLKEDDMLDFYFLYLIRAKECLERWKESGDENEAARACLILLKLEGGIKEWFNLILI